MLRLLTVIAALSASPVLAESSDPRPLVDALLRAAGDGSSEVLAGTASLDDGVFRLDHLTLTSQTERVVLEGIVATGALVDDAGRFRADVVRIEAAATESFEPDLLTSEATELIVEEVVLAAGAIALQTPPAAWMGAFRRASAAGSSHVESPPDEPPFAMTTGRLTVAIERPTPADYLVETTMSGVSIDIAPLTPELVDAGIAPDDLVLAFDMTDRRVVSLGRGTLSIDAELVSQGLGTARVSTELHGIGAGEIDLLGLWDSRLFEEWPAGVQLWRLDVTLADDGGVAALKRLTERMGFSAEVTEQMAAGAALPAGDAASRAVHAFIEDGGTLHVAFEPPTPEPVAILATMPANVVFDRLRTRIRSEPPAN